MIYVMDACAMLALLRKEPGEHVVANALADPNADCYAHAMNLCEVYYIFHRDSGEASAETAISDLKGLGIIEGNDLDSAFWKDVGKLKAQHRASLADFCAITLTNRVGGTLLTSDHHELDVIAAAGVCPITFIR